MVDMGNTTILSKNSKLDKDGDYLLTGIQLSAGSRKVCRWAGECKKLCLNTSFFLKQKNSVKAQQKRTSLWFNNREQFLLMFKYELMKKVWEAIQKGKKGVRVRANTLSDIPELHDACRQASREVEKATGVSEGFIEGYEYTKNPREHRPNYVYSFNEKTTEDDFHWNITRRNIAVVFDTKPSKEFPKFWRGYEVIDGDKSDDRLSDPKQKGLIIGLRAKADARKADSPFIVKTKGLA